MTISNEAMAVLYDRLRSRQRACGSLLTLDCTTASRSPDCINISDHGSNYGIADNTAWTVLNGVITEWINSYPKRCFTLSPSSRIAKSSAATLRLLYLHQEIISRSVRHGMGFGIIASYHGTGSSFCHPPSNNSQQAISASFQRCVIQASLACACIRAVFELSPFTLLTCLPPLAAIPFSTCA